MRVPSGVFAIMTVAGVATFNHALPLQPQSKIWVAGGSTVRDYKCVAKVIDASLVAPSAETQKLEIADFVKEATIAVPVDQLACGNGKMDEHLQNALKAKQFPKAQFKLDSYVVTGDAIALKGDMTIAGKTLPIEFTGTVTDASGNIRATATKSIKMSEWGVKPPSLMMGAMKVKDDVTIGFDVALKR